MAQDVRVKGDSFSEISGNGQVPRHSSGFITFHKTRFTPNNIERDD